MVSYIPSSWNKSPFLRTVNCSLNVGVSPNVNLLDAAVVPLVCLVLGYVNVAPVHPKKHAQIL